MQYHYQRNKMKDVHNNYYKALTIESISDSTLYCLLGHICDAGPKFWFQFKKGPPKIFPIWASLEPKSRYNKKSLSLAMSRKKYEKIIQAVKG